MKASHMQRKLAVLTNMLINTKEYNYHENELAYMFLRQKQNNFYAKVLNWRSDEINVETEKKERLRTGDHLHNRHTYISTNQLSRSNCLRFAIVVIVVLTIVRRDEMADDRLSPSISVTL